MGKRCLAYRIALEIVEENDLQPTDVLAASGDGMHLSLEKIMQKHGDLVRRRLSVLSAGTLGVIIAGSPRDTLRSVINGGDEYLSPTVLKRKATGKTLLRHMAAWVIANWMRSILDRYDRERQNDLAEAFQATMN